MSEKNLSAPKAAINMTEFGTAPCGTEVALYSLQNASGMTVDITNYGGIVVRVLTADRNGNFADVALGFDNLAAYIKDSPYFGAIVGRYGNRIANGKFTLDGQTYELATNNDPAGIPCALHGGIKGFDKAVYDAKPYFANGCPALELKYLSKDGEEGYPGNLELTVNYILTADNALEIVYSAVTDKATPLGLTNHSYFNLKGEGEGSVLSHVATINAKNYTPVTAGLIPTGVIEPVADTPFDFTEPNAIGDRINDDNEQLKFGNGYDHNYVLDDSQDGDLALAAMVYEPESGRMMEVLTTEPGVQFYTGNFLDGMIGKSGRKYNTRDGFCLETQRYPDSPNQPQFPNAILRPGEQFTSKTVYRFGAK